MEPQYEAIVENLYDSKTDTIKTWSFLETFSTVGSVIALYLLLVLRLLPEFMRYRKPYSLNRVLRVYNAFQVLFSLYAVILYTRYIFQHGIITTRCPKGPQLEKVIEEIWPYFIAKHVDLLDTVFFVLRKKDNQVTFLHVYHHTAMVAWTWFHLMYHPTDHFNVVGLINSFVHVIMYTYYGLASMGPEYAKYIWWKKHVTKIQLIQFILVVSNLYYQQALSPCPIPPAFHYFCVFSITSFFVLFMNFYLRSYSKMISNNSDGVCTKSDDTKIA
ncbi:elongation of very long chain fatty acids protein 7-like [Aricia agestis]|uniref:elongation of very long chain fatty acids protein 7-like n=1 Tax=Aricia agestis TaxID=91739 RepID=UPI001C20AD0A|nr:elongation of very long chain fatty acids protein 7-like [Aricia agestis]